MSEEVPRPFKSPSEAADASAGEATDASADEAPALTLREGEVTPKRRTLAQILEDLPAAPDAGWKYWRTRLRRMAAFPMYTGLPR